MVNKPVDGGSCNHWIMEDMFPLREGKTAGDHYTSSLIAIGQQAEQHLHLIMIVLRIGDVVNDDRIIFP